MVLARAARDMKAIVVIMVVRKILVKCDSRLGRRDGSGHSPFYLLTGS